MSYTVPVTQITEAGFIPVQNPDSSEIRNADAVEIERLTRRKAGSGKFADLFKLAGIRYIVLRIRHIGHRHRSQANIVVKAATAQSAQQANQSQANQS